MALPQKLPYDLMLTQWAGQLNPVLANPILNGLAINNIVLLAGVPKTIPTTLGKIQQGWFITDISSSGAGWLFTVTAAAATTGAKYTNNLATFTVVNTISAGVSLLATSTGTPGVSGTLTKATGTGDATITFSSALNIQPIACVQRTTPFNTQNITLKANVNATINIWVF